MRLFFIVFLCDLLKISRNISANQKINQERSKLACMRFLAPSTGCIVIGSFDLSSYVVIGYRKVFFCETASRLPNNWLKHIRSFFQPIRIKIMAYCVFQVLNFSPFVKFRAHRVFCNRDHEKNSIGICLLRNTFV